MFIVHKSLPRRTVLRGIGAAIALPLLDAMVPALSAAGQSVAQPVPRLGFVYVPNGMIMNMWTPTGAATLELSPTLSPLEAFRDRSIVVSGLSCHLADSFDEGAGDHSRGAAAWLSGVRPKRTEGANVQAGTTADQLAAAVIGKDTPLTTLELGLEHIDVVGNCDQGYACVYMNTIAWRTPTTPLPTEINPRQVFRRLFGSGGSAAERFAEMKANRSLLDTMMEKLGRLQKTLGPGDTRRLDQYLEAIRDVERRIQRVEARADVSLPTLDLPPGIPDGFDEHAKLMIDLQVLAFQADVTRVVTFQMGRELSNRTYREVGVDETHHGISHHMDDPNKIAKLTVINRYHIQTLAYFLEKLRSVPDGEGSLLDHVMLMYGAGMSNSNKHDHSPLPVLLVGGGAGRLKGGRHLRQPDDTPLSNLLLTLLQKLGSEDRVFGDSTGTIADL